MINLNLTIITAASVNNNRILEKWSKEFAYIQCKLGAINICVIRATKLLPDPLCSKTNILILVGK